MKILFAITHFYQPSSGFYGSYRADPTPRIEALSRAIESLHVQFGSRQGLLNAQKRALDATNETDHAEIDIVVCTTGASHLVDRLPTKLFRHRNSKAKPLFLGYECHEVLREGLGDYDYYCYLEDDIELTDPWFFRKLAWFNGKAGPRAVLQPNRYERTSELPVLKLYIDCNLRDPRISERFQKTTIRPRIEAEMMGRKLQFQRINNPHSGCFFLNAKQMKAWVRQPYFLDRSEAFGGPLESAATLGIMKCFDVYKPSRENADFLEVVHLHHRYIGRYLDFDSDPPFKFRVLNPNARTEER